MEVESHAEQQCQECAASLKYFLLVDNEEHDVPRQVQRAAKRPQSLATAGELSGWLTRPSEPTVHRKHKPVRNAAQAERLSRRNQQAAADVPDVGFAFYQDAEAYIKAYRLAKRALLRWQQRPPSDGPSRSDTDDAVFQNLNGDDVADGPVAEEGLALHLHVAKMLRSFLSQGMNEDGATSGAKHAQSTWYRHLSDEISRLENLKESGAEASNVENSTLINHKQEMEMIGKRFRAEAKYSRNPVGRPSDPVPKSTLKVATCEVFPSISANNRTNATTYDSPKGKREDSGRRAGRPQSARWLGGFGMANSTRIQIGESSMNRLVFGPRRPLSGVSIRLRELQFMRRLSDLVKECERAKSEVPAQPID